MEVLIIIFICVVLIIALFCVAVVIREIVIEKREQKKVQEKDKDSSSLNIKDTNYDVSNIKEEKKEELKQ